MVTTRSSKSSASQSANQPDSDQPKIDQALGASGGETKTKGKKRTASKAKDEEKEDDQEVQAVSKEQVEEEHADKKRKVEGDAQDVGKDDPAPEAKDESKEDSKPETESKPVEHQIPDKSEVTAAEKDLTKHADVLEYGRIHFLYKPRVEIMHPSDISEVQRLHIILQPHDEKHPETFEKDGKGEKRPVLSRLIGVGRKVLPDAEKKSEGAPPPPQSTGGRGRGNNLGRGGRQPCVLRVQTECRLATDKI